MERDQVVAEFAAIAKDGSELTKMGRFLTIADVVEHAISIGVKRQAILRTLAKQGLVLTPATLNSYLLRSRRLSPRAPAAPRIPSIEAPAAVPRELARNPPSLPVAAESAAVATQTQPASLVPGATSTTVVAPESPPHTLEQILRGARPDVFELERRAFQRERENRAAADAASAAARDAKRAAQLAALSASKPP